MDTDTDINTETEIFCGQNPTETYRTLIERDRLEIQI